MTLRSCLCIALLLMQPALAQEKKTEPAAKEEKAVKKSTQTKTAFIGVMVREGEVKGEIVVLTVLPDGPAARGGLQPGDVILRINNAKATDLETAVQLIRSQKPGKKCVFLVVRDGKEKAISVIPESM